MKPKDSNLEKIVEKYMEKNQYSLDTNLNTLKFPVVIMERTQLRNFGKECRDYGVNLERMNWLLFDRPSGEPYGKSPLKPKKPSIWQRIKRKVNPLFDLSPKPKNPHFDCVPVCRDSKIKSTD